MNLYSTMETLDDETSIQKRRRSRWDPPTSCSSNSSDTGSKRRKSRWDNDPPPNPVTHLPKGIEFDPELIVLNARLLAINSKLKSSKLLDDRPIDARSPSPEPVFDNLGIRINTREFRARDKLNCERQRIISEIVTKNPEFKPPGGEFKKHFKKIYVPLKEYPGYNFIGLIIGPRGNTQKRMEKETGARISLRGKGSLKKDSSSNDDLHVFVEAESWEPVQAATVMVEALLKPVDDMFNVHKREQLKELAELNGTIGYGVKSEVSCEICGDSKHSTGFCPLKKKTAVMDEAHQKFLAEMGGTVSESWWLGGPEISSNGSQAGLGSTVVPKEYDETNLYVGYLPLTVDDDGMVGLFSSFGEIVVSKVIKDVATGVSKGYGFVKFANVQQAKFAIASMNGYPLDGRTIAVRVAGKPPQPTLAPLPNVPVLPPPPGTGTSQHGCAFMYPHVPQFGVQYPPQPTITPVPNALVLPPCTGPARPGGTSMYPPVPQFGVQYPPQPTIAPVPNAPVLPSSIHPGGTFFGAQHPQLEPPSHFMPESVSSSTHGRYDFASFDEKPSYSSRQSESSTSVPVYTNVNSVTSKSVTSYTYVLSNGAILPPLSVSESTMGPSQSPSNVPWATNSPMSLPSVSAEKSKFKSEAEYKKFMASMKWADF